MPEVLVAPGKTTVATDKHYSSTLKKPKSTKYRILYQQVKPKQDHLPLRNRGFPVMDDNLPEELALAFERHARTQ